MPNLTIAEAAEAVGVSQKTVRRWIASGDLPAYRLGGKLVRIHQDDLEKLGRRIPAAGSR